MFGGRRGRGTAEGEASGPDWPRLPDIRPDLRPDARQVRQQLPAGATTRPPPIPPPRVTLAAADPAVTKRESEEELLDRLTAFRSAVADALYETSNDYRILCNLAHADLKSCGDLMQELRARLDDDTHYRVLAKLDEAHALTLGAVRGRQRGKPRSGD